MKYVNATEYYQQHSVAFTYAIFYGGVYSRTAKFTQFQQAGQLPCSTKRHHRYL